MQPGNVDHDEGASDNPGPDSTVERRHVLKSGLATSVVVAGGAVLSVISCLRKVFSLSDDTPESL